MDSLLRGVSNFFNGYMGEALVKGVANFIKVSFLRGVSRFVNEYIVEALVKIVGHFINGFVSQEAFLNSLMGTWIRL